MAKSRPKIGDVYRGRAANGFFLAQYMGMTKYGHRWYIDSKRNAEDCRPEPNGYYFFVIDMLQQKATALTKVGNFSCFQPPVLVKSWIDLGNGGQWLFQSVDGSVPQFGSRNLLPKYKTLPSGRIMPFSTLLELIETEWTPDMKEV
jgi:hypothetical protein